MRSSIRSQSRIHLLGGTFPQQLIEDQQAIFGSMSLELSLKNDSLKVQATRDLPFGLMNWELRPLDGYFLDSLWLVFLRCRFPQESSRLDCFQTGQDSRLM